MSLSRIFAALSVLLWSTQEVRAAAYAVVVGIDEYAVFSDLEGAVNDAEDLAAALDRRGADVIKLLNEDATRSAVVGALRSQIAKAQAGDVVVFTYAGHGVQLDEALIGDEDDGKDENFALHGFAKSGSGAGERLRDNDIAFLFAAAAPGVSLFFVADSCHSGTMTRSPIVGGALGKTRFLDEEIGVIEDDPLPPPDASTFQLEASDLDNVVFAAAARDFEETPEVEIDGVRRGALSWSIARALDGFAEGGDGVTELAELREYVRAEVRAFSGARQTPDVEFGSGRLQGIRALFNGGGFELKQATQTTESPLAIAPPPALHVVGELSEKDETRLGDVARIVDEREQADLVWNSYDGRLIDRLAADLLGELDQTDRVATAIAKWRAVGGLARWSPRRAFDLRSSGGDGRYSEGDLVKFIANGPEAGPEEGALTLLNLASDGEVQYIFPPKSMARSGKDVLRRRSSLEIGPAAVKGPFGADHVIGVIMSSDSMELRDRLRALSGKRDPQKALQIIAEIASDSTTSRVAVLPLFSAPIGVE